MQIRISIINATIGLQEELKPEDDLFSITLKPGRLLSYPKCGAASGAGEARGAGSAVAAAVAAVHSSHGRAVLTRVGAVVVLVQYRQPAASGTARQPDSSQDSQPEHHQTADSRQQSAVLPGAGVACSALQ